MKLIELNIGLESKALGKLNYIEVLNALTGRGFILAKYRLVESESKDGKETCLAWKGTPPKDWQAQLSDLSDRLGQDCIAIVGFIGQSPYDAFVPSLWVSPEEEEKSYHIQSTPLIYTPSIFRWIVETVRPFDVPKAQELFESLGLPAEVASLLATSDSKASFTYDDEKETVNVTVK